MSRLSIRTLVKCSVAIERVARLAGQPGCAAERIPHTPPQGRDVAGSKLCKCDVCATHVSALDRRLGGVATSTAAAAASSSASTRMLLENSESAKSTKL
eukprot:1190141-Pleurochrysis_carterae.AAC.1